MHRESDSCRTRSAEYHVFMASTLADPLRDARADDPQDDGDVRISSASPIAARRHPLVASVRHALEHSCGFALDTSTGPILVGVSGGADSLALLIALRAVQHQLREAAPNFRPITVHVNHHLRGRASDADAACVKDICARFEIECIVRDAAVDPAQPGIEATARRLRYDALQAEARRLGAAVIAVAHHAEDQFETMLMNLSRGAGLDGLSGMAWSRPLSGDCRLIRPLLRETHEACRSLCATAGVRSRYDQMNHAVTFARSRVRHIVRPMLEALWPDAPRRAAATAELLDCVNDLLRERLEVTFGDAARREWPRRALAVLPAPLIAAGLRRAALHGAGSLSDDLSSAALVPAAERIREDDPRPARFRLANDFEVVVRASRVQLIQSTPEVNS